MTQPPLDLPVRYFRGQDGATLAYRETGTGRPLILIHGYFSTARVNWIRRGHAATIATQGHRVIMPDLRGHADSDKSHDAAAYPPDVLADDGFALIEQLGLTDYHLGGYSLGGRTTIRMLARGARPRRAVVMGTGLEPIVSTRESSSHFRHILTNLGTFQRGTPEWDAEAFLKTVGGDPAALLLVLETFVGTPREAIAGIQTPTLVLMGNQDTDHGCAEALCNALPYARLGIVPGNHMSAVVNPDLGLAIVDFLSP
jgi:pimeloyl-ACP methyl ester carboxylesterase